MIGWWRDSGASRRVTVLGAVMAAVAGTFVGVLPASATTGPPPTNGSTATTQSATQDWPTYLHDVARSSASGEQILTTTSVPYMRQSWSYATGGVIAAEPAVVAGVAYVGSWDGYEYALNASTGALIWKTSLGTMTDSACATDPAMGITSSATVYTNANVNGGKPVVYVGGSNDSNNNADWYALDAATGNILWDISTGNGTQAGGDYNWASPLIVTDPADGNPYAYVGVASVCDSPLIQGKLLKVSLITHQVVGEADMVPNGQVGGGIWTSPTYDAATNNIYVSTGTLNLYSQTLSQAVVAINASTMQVESSWQLPFEAAVTDSDWGTTPTLVTDSNGDQLVSVANKNGILYTFKRTDLAAGPIWQTQLAYGGDCPTCGDGTISSGAFANNVLYFAAGRVSDANGLGHGGSVTAFNPANGSVIWRHYLQSSPVGSLVYDNGMLFFGNGGVEEVINAATGQDIWDYNLQATTYSAPSIAGGVLYQGTVDGVLHAFAPPSTLPASPPADSNCPSGYTCQDLGNMSNRAAGSEVVNSNGSVTVTGSGNERSDGDSYRFIWRPESGDFQESVQDLSETAGPSNCSSLPSGDSSCYNQPQIGIVIRQSTLAGAPYYAALQDPTYPAESENQANVIIYYRDHWGGPQIELTQHYPLPFPAYLMVQRHFDTFQTLYSTDNVHWTLISGTIHTIVMPTTLDAGMGVASYMNTATSQGTYTGLTFGAPTTTYVEQPEAHACPSPWSCYDVGAGSPIGDQTVSSGVWTVSGGGQGVTLDTDGAGTTGTHDQFHFIYQTMSGDGTITARLTGLTNGGAQDQAVLMMRANLTETSPYYGVVINPNGTATVMWRLYDGIQERQTVSAGTVSFPTWFQINRYTDTSHSPTTTYYSTLTSTDGSSWTQVTSSTVAVNLGANPLEGFGGNTTNPKVVNTSTWDNLSTSSTSQKPPGVCPPQYTCTDIGNSTLPGSQEYDNQATWNVQAGGSDMWANYDNFRFIYQQLTADGTVSAEVKSAGPAPDSYDDEWEKAGVMLRASTDPQSVYYGVFITPQHGLAVQWRSTYAQGTQQIDYTGAPSYPLYLMVTRWTDPHAGGQTYFTAYYSTDNKTFTVVPNSTVAVALTGTVLAGMAADSWNEAYLFPVTFYNYALFDNTENPPPGACPTSVAGCADIGGPTPPGGETLSGTTLTMTGTGTDMWSNYDQFHYVWQSLSGDGAVSADMTAQQNTGAWAKAGVMMRSSSGAGGLTDPSAPYYGVFVTPSNGIAVQWRSAENGNTSQIDIAGPSPEYPVYLKVTRYTDSSGNQNFAAFTSSDGSTWTWIFGSTVQLPLTGTIMAGWAADSYSSTATSQVTFSNIAEAAGTQSPSGACFSGYSCTDIGSPTPAGTQTASGSTWNVYGGGGDIWGSSDSFRYVYQAMSADGTVSAEVASQQNTSTWAKAGVMMRGTTDPASPYYAVFVTPSNGIAVQWRATQGGSTSQVGAAATSPQYPIYLAVVRWTDTSGASPVTYYYAETSQNGTSWTIVPGSVQQLTLPASFLAGVAVTSHNTSELSEVSLNSVTVNTTSAPPPNICEQAYTCADIGGATPAGTQSFTSSGTWTVQGGGGDIWGTSDSFRYIYTTLAGAGTSSLRVNSMSNASPSPWAKAGIMMRATSDPGAAYYAVLVTPSNSVVVQYRTAQGGNPTQIQVTPTLAAPIYLEIVRNGTSNTTFTAAYSTDGSTWTTIAQSSVTIAALSGTLLDGMATTSHDSNNLITVVYDKLNL